MSETITPALAGLGELEGRLLTWAQALVDQRQARVLVPPQRPGSGHWFGGGNLTRGNDGALYLVGRYRNHGDSRTGLGLGERGLELAIFRGQDGSRGPSLAVDKVLSLSKADLSTPSRQVVSIEGSCLRWTEAGVELLVSSEKQGLAYPRGWEEFLKPGAGVWTIDRLRATTIEGLASAPIEPLLASSDLDQLHVKDPFWLERSPGEVLLYFCTHPYCWSSSNTAVTRLDASPLQPPPAESQRDVQHDWFPRGASWDVAITRATCLVPVPRIGPFADRPSWLVFYDGGESLRDLDQHATAVHRPRGYSCEELGGVAHVEDDPLNRPRRLSKYLPALLSPWGTRCSRYVDVLATEEGYYATWQQSQPDGSQPLVTHFLSHEATRRVLGE